MNKSIKYFIAVFFFILSACEKDSSVENCLCTISLNGYVWSKYNISNGDSCKAPKGYNADCNCE